MDGTAEAKEISWSIGKATYDMTHAVFENGSFTYDKASHTIEVTGLPTGVTASYDPSNTQTEAGEYTITASFTGDTDNYFAITETLTATLTIGERVIPLTSTSSDVSHAFFTCPEIEGVEPGMQALFVMKSRGGVEGGQVYTVKKTVTILAAEVDPTAPKITGYKVDGQPVTQFTANASFVMTGDNLAAFDMLGGRTDKVVMTFTEGARKGEVLDMPYQGVSSSPRYAANLGGIYVSTPNVELVSGERGTLQVTIDGKKSNVIPFEVA